MDRITAIVSQYVGERDAFVKLRSSSFAVMDDGGGQRKLSELIDGHASALAFALPSMNLVEWEGLAELVNSRLNFVRQIEQGRP